MDSLLLIRIKHFLSQLKDHLDVIYLFPYIVKWFYCLKIKKNLSYFQLKDVFGNKATLYQHNEWESGKREDQAILILHGLYAHPLVILPLIDTAKATETGPVFSLHVTYNEANFDVHRSFIEQAIDHIEKMSHENKSPLKGIVMAGHSMGAIESAYRAFVEIDLRISSVISIAGRLKVVESINSPCSDFLRPSIDKIYKGVKNLPLIPLYQIVGRDDWNAPLESTLIRDEDKEYYHIIEGAMHFDILFHKETHLKFFEFLKKSAC